MTTEAAKQEEVYVVVRRMKVDDEIVLMRARVA
jgi:hypothetical protein